MTFQPAAERKPRSRGGSSAKPRTTTTRAALPSLRKELDAFLAGINELLHAFDPIDALDDAELAALIDGLDKEARKNARLHRGLQAVLTLGSGGGLGFVIGIIVGRRLARRKVFGAQLSQAVDTIGGVVIQGVKAEPSEAAAAMAAMRDMLGGVDLSGNNGAPTG